MAMNFNARKRMANAIALGIVKGLSFFAVGLLVLIIGYLVYRGVYKSDRTESDVVPMAIMERTGIELMQPPLTVLSNKKSNLRHLSWFTLRNMAVGSVATLRKVSSTDAAFFMYVEESAVDALAEMLCLTSQRLMNGGAVIASREQVLERGSQQDGALVVLAGELEGKAPRGFRVPILDSYVLAANPSVTALYDNNRVGSLTGEQVAGLLGGKIANWATLDGGDIPVVALDASMGSLDDVVTALSSTDGAVAVLPAAVYYQASRQKLPVELLRMVRIDRGPNITWSYLTGRTIESGKYGGILTIIGNTFVMVILTTLIAGPLGIAAAVYLVEYAKKGRLTSIIRAGIDVLAGIPSIIFGLFGLLVFVQLFGWSFSLISGTLTVALMILPTIIRTSEEAIHSVDRSLREASIGLGATRIETIWKVVLPSASNGIATGIILAIGRAVGETAALIYTIGSSTDFVKSLTSSSRVLAMHIYLTITEGQSFDRAFASALVLVVVVLSINFVARALMTSSSRKQKGKDNG